MVHLGDVRDLTLTRTLTLALALALALTLALTLTLTLTLTLKQEFVTCNGPDAKVRVAASLG